MLTPTDETELTVRHGATLRDRYPLLMAQPSPTIPTMREQAEARGEHVPVGKTAAEVRAAGYEVSLEVPDDCALATREEAESPASNVSIASTGRLTDFVWLRNTASMAKWYIARPDALAAMTPESIAEEHELCLRALRDGIERASAPTPAGTGIFTALTATACVIGILEAEAHRREKLLGTAAKFSLAT